MGRIVSAETNKPEAILDEVRFAMTNGSSVEPVDHHLRKNDRPPVVPLFGSLAYVSGSGVS